MISARRWRWRSRGSSSCSLKRPGGQSQFSGALSAQQASRPALRELQAWIAGHLDQDLSVAALAAQAGLSERSFARAFRAEIGQTPAAYVGDAPGRARPRPARGRRRIAGGRHPGHGLHQPRSPAPGVSPARGREPRRLPRALPARRLKTCVPPGVCSSPQIPPPRISRTRSRIPASPTLSGGASATSTSSATTRDGLAMFLGMAVLGSRSTASWLLGELGRVHVPGDGDDDDVPMVAG